MAQFNLLASKLKEASQEYYTTGKSPISDTAFDLAQEVLKKEDPTAKEVTAVGWGYEVSRDSTPGEKVKHKYGLVGSLSKAYSWDEIDSVFKGAMVDISLKLDGISIVLYYDKGVFVRAVTRGDGVTGIDVTNKIEKCLHPSELRLKDFSFTGAVRGEVLMYNTNWNSFLAIHPDAKNSRNSTAGLINAAEVSDDLKYVNVVVYKVVGCDSRPPMSMPTMNSWLAENFRHTVPHCMGDKLTQQHCERFSEFAEMLNQNTLPIDGLVMKLCFLDWNSQTGEVIYKEQAFKFAAEVAITEVKGIEWNLTKNRYLMPRINVDTVHISGTDVSWCTGYNAKYILDSKINTGSVVTIEKHGEIIPNINEVILPMDPELPDTCPTCGHKLYWEGVHLKCNNETCGNAKLQDLIIWTNNLAPVDGFSDTLRVRYLTSELGDNASVEDLMTLQESRLPATSIQNKMYQEMFYRIHHDTFDLVQVIKALNIPRMADSNAKKLAGYISTLNNLGHSYNEIVDILLDPEQHDSVVASIGTANAAAVFSHPTQLRRILLVADRISALRCSTISMRSVAVTGKLSVSRTEFEKELEKNGWKIGDVSKNTEYLITDDPNSNSSKNIRADKLGVPKVTESEFREKYIRVNS